MKSGFEGIHRQVQKHWEATRVEKSSLNRLGVYSAVRSLRDVFSTTLNRPTHRLTTAPQFSMCQFLVVPEIITTRLAFQLKAGRNTLTEDGT